MKIKFKVKGKNDSSIGKIEFDLKRLLIVGYSGSNIEKIMEHIKELKEHLGVPEPKKIPTIFECSKELLTKEKDIKFVGNMTSGEVEYLIIKHLNEIYIGIGSDHTDRKLESISVLKAKQICPKPIGEEVWLYKDIKESWNEIEAESYQNINGQRVLYQKGRLSEILSVEKIISELENRVGNIEDSIIFSGTVPLESNFKYGDEFICKIFDKSNNSSLNLNYKINKISEEEK
ncbi:DUF2848 domain-containing protein [Fusobacterium nucleatum]|uniref:DUF2848 domain-containing protein n=1 Tax=Fusobacterium nucleatum subsp. polymorphum TaxID=76857 RepID=A0A2C6AVN1_FUSNP|nr:DUF2848 family protein [Fusobacterium polymorphum]PHH96020.1 hypothetical protein CA840_00700 [Fusobacterium polymorphum]